MGDPGVGKTAIAEGMAFNIVPCNVPEFLLEYKVYNLDIRYCLLEVSIEETLKNVLNWF